MKSYTDCFRNYISFPRSDVYLKTSTFILRDQLDLTFHNMQEEKETTQIQPQFMKEEVYFIECACCGSTLCNRGMKSFLVADEKVELYSTDQVDKW